VKIVAALSDPRGHYAPLRHVFERSARSTRPGVEIEVVDLPPMASRQEAMARSFLAAAGRAVAVGGEVAVCDVDLMFLRSIDEAFSVPFDVAYTVRETRMTYNTGLWFLRPGGAPFVARWCWWTERILANPGGHRGSLDRYGGIDQAALAAAIKEDSKHALLKLPCREWNATQSEWASVDDQTRVVHVKSALRRAVLGRERSADPALLPLIERFRSWEEA
jgi:hypothetical protein